jgi:hypothetical protein
MPTVTISKSDFQRHIIPDDSPDASYLDQEGFEQRKAQYERGEFHFIGVRAAVTLRIPYGTHYIETTVESPGLWGIESDSDAEYLSSVFEEESDILRDMLDELRIRVIDQ